MAMRRLEIGSIKLPRIYVVSKMSEIEECKENGIPYIVWRGSDEDLVKQILYPTLRKMFPGVKWKEVLGISGRKQTMVKVPGHKENPENYSDEGPASTETDMVEGNSGFSDIAEDVREFSNGGTIGVNEMKLDDYVGDLSAVVNIEELQALHLLPSFLDEITTNIKKNLYNLAWWEGYNKKLGVPVGNFNAGTESPNLMILDISGSIPRSIAATMLSLIDTLRSQANADLIITAAKSEFYPIGSELPSPQELRNEFGLGNEARMFNEILRKHVRGRKFSNVISFGDNDCPISYERWERLSDSEKMKPLDLEGTVVHEVWHYHTWEPNRSTGYAKWADDICEKRHFNKSWSNIMMTDAEAEKAGVMRQWE